MTSIFHYIATIALAIVVAAGAALVYVLYIHFAQPPTTTATAPSTATAPPTIQPATPPPSTQSPITTNPPSQRSTVRSVILYIATPEVITKCTPRLSNKYIYYFNVTVDRIRAEDLVLPYDYQRGDYVFKARAGDIVLNLTGAYRLSSYQEFFKQYNPNVTEQMGLVNVYLEIEADKSLNITAVRYLDAEYNVNRVVYISCIKQIEIKMVNATNGRPLIAPDHGFLGLIPADATYRVNVTLPPGRYQLIAPPGVQIEPREVEGGKPQMLTIKLQENKPQVYDPLVINATRVD